MTATSFRQGACMPLQSLSCWLVDKNTKIEYLMRMNSGNLPTSQVEDEAQNTWKFPVSSKDIYVLSHSVVSDSFRPHGLQPTRHLCSWGFFRQEYGSGLPMPSSRGSSQPGDWTQVSCIAGGFFTVWVTIYRHWGKKKRKKQVVWLQSSASSHYWDCILKIYINPPGPKSMWNAYFLYSFPVEHLYLWP